MADNAIQEKLTKFFSQYKKLDFKKGETLISVDEKPNGVFYLTDGVIKIYGIAPNGDELTINTFKPYSIFPMAWVLNDTNVAYYHEAQTAVTVWKAPKEDFLDFIEKEPELLLDLLKRIYRGLDGYFMRMENLLSGSAKNRLIVELIIHAKRFGTVNGNEINSQLKLTEKDLASQSGIARETVSRELQKLKEKGLIVIENKMLTIPNIEKIEEELNTFNY